MISTEVLKYLVSQRMADAACLLKGFRHKGCIYLMGYSLEYALKLRICATLGFSNGFPESTSEFRHYVASGSISDLPLIHPKNIREIKIHDLDGLLFWSGKQPAVASKFGAEWLLLKTWTPEKRYIRERINHAKAVDFVNIARKIINTELL